MFKYFGKLIERLFFREEPLVDHSTTQMEIKSPEGYELLDNDDVLEDGDLVFSYNNTFYIPVWIPIKGNEIIGKTPKEINSVLEEKIANMGRHIFKHYYWVRNGYYFARLNNPILYWEGKLLSDLYE